MTDQRLNRILTHLGMPTQPRYSVPEVALILGLKDSQVLTLLKKHLLPGTKASHRKWGHVFHEDLAAYLASIHGSAHSGSPISKIS